MSPLNRREFLEYSSGAMAVVTLPARAAAQPRAQISLGHSLYGMQEVPLTEAVAHCALIGFRNVELVLDPGFTAKPKQLCKAVRREMRTQLAGLGLSVSALMRNLRTVGGLTPTQNLEAIKEAAQFTAAGADALALAFESAAAVTLPTGGLTLLSIDSLSPAAAGK